MSVEKRKRFDEMVEQDKLRYEKEMEEWRKTHPEVPKVKEPAKKKQLVIAQEESSDDDDDDDSDDDSDDDDKSDEEDSD